MISRLDVAVDRRRRARPLWRAALCRQRAALEPVTERLRSTIPMLAARPNFAPKETLPDKLLAHIASLGWEHMVSAADTSGLPTRSNRRFRPCESCAPHSSMPLTVRFGTDSAMTPGRAAANKPTGERHAGPSRQAAWPVSQFPYATVPYRWESFSRDTCSHHVTQSVKHRPHRMLSLRRLFFHQRQIRGAKRPFLESIKIRVLVRPANGEPCRRSVECRVV